MLIDKSEIASKLSRLKGILPKNPTIESLKCILFKNNSLFANNLEIAMMVPLDTDTEEEFLLPPKAIEMIENLPSGNIKISVDRKNVLTIETDEIKNKIKSLDPANYPEMNMNVATGEKATIPGDILQESINSILYAINANCTNTTMSGVLLESDGGKLNIVGTDGYRLAWSIVNYDKKIKMIIPKTTAQKLLGFGLDGDVEILYNNKHAIFKLEEYTFYSRLINGAYIDYKTVLPQHSNSVIINKSILMESVNRAGICTESKGPSSVVFDIEEDVLKISAKSALGEYSEILTLKDSIQSPIRIAFNARYLIDCLKSYKDHEITLNFGKATAPMVIDQATLKSLVLPVRLKE